MRWTRPRFLLPVHGEYRQRYAHARLAEADGLAPDRILLAENGDVLEFAEQWVLDPPSRVEIIEV